jgi:hypothetical protein
MHNGVKSLFELSCFDAGEFRDRPNERDTSISYP